MSQFKLTLGVAALGTFPILVQMDPKVSLPILLGGGCSWIATNILIPKISHFMLKNRIFGMDINKKGSKGGEKQIPECVGLSAAVAFIMIGMALSIFLRGDTQQLLQHLAVMVIVLGTVMLGFSDDMLDLPWRYKLLFPFFIIMPMVAVYAGPTHITVVAPFSALLGSRLDLGVFYLLYLTLLGIYQTNTINIFAGINGLQVGQSIVAAAGMLGYFGVNTLLNGHADRYNYSVYLLVSLLGSTIALMRLNAYPSQIFIGDTFCYFAGIVLAVAAIYGEIPLVCHWFMFPQLINFLYSTPQLFGFVPCPRHRLTQYLVGEDKLKAIDTNLNLLNLSLRILGPTNQGKLCVKLLFFQLIMCLVPIMYLVVRFWSTH